MLGPRVHILFSLVPIITLGYCTSWLRQSLTVEDGQPGPWRISFDPPMRLLSMWRRIARALYRWHLVDQRTSPTLSNDLSAGLRRLKSGTKMSKRVRKYKMRWFYHSCPQRVNHFMVMPTLENDLLNRRPAMVIPQLRLESPWVCSWEHLVPWLDHLRNSKRRNM